MGIYVFVKVIHEANMVDSRHTSEISVCDQLSLECSCKTIKVNAIQSQHNTVEMPKMATPQESFVFFLNNKNEEINY